MTTVTLHIVKEINCNTNH